MLSCNALVTPSQSADHVNHWSWSIPSQLPWIQRTSLRLMATLGSCLSDFRHLYWSTHPYRTYHSPVVPNLFLLLLGDAHMIKALDSLVWESPTATSCGYTRFKFCRHFYLYGLVTHINSWVWPTVDVIRCNHYCNVHDWPIMSRFMALFAIPNHDHWSFLK